MIYFGRVPKRKKGQRGWRPRQAVRERLRAQRHAQKRISIDEHPDIVEKKERIGDWEGDTVIGKGQKGALVTLTERVSRYTLAYLLSSRYAEGVTATIINLLAPPHTGKRHTMPFDNGKEFAGHESIAKILKMSVSFAHPYHSWERWN